MKLVEVYLRRHSNITTGLTEFLSAKDMSDLEDSDDLLVTLVDTLRSAIQIDAHIAITEGSGALDLLFTIAKHGSSNIQLTMMVNEAFELVVGSLAGGDTYVALCAKVLPSLTGAFDVGDMTGDNPLVEVSHSGSSPIPHLLILTSQSLQLNYSLFSQKMDPSPFHQDTLPPPYQN